MGRSDTSVIGEGELVCIVVERLTAMYVVASSTASLAVAELKLALSSLFAAAIAVQVNRNNR